MIQPFFIDSDFAFIWLKQDNQSTFNPKLLAPYSSPIACNPDKPNLPDDYGTQIQKR